VALELIYKDMPCTTGCDKCKEVNGDDAWWCCRTMNPSMYYSEFLLVWEHVQDNWSPERKSKLIVRAIKNYLSSENIKGCIFFAEDKCNCYQRRPFMCRMYGLIPKESWDKRVGQLEERMKEGTTKWWRPQCELVKAEKEISQEDEMTWFYQVRESEIRIGMPHQFIKAHDHPAGCYRTFHDHLLLELLPSEGLNRLTELKLGKPTQEDIDKFAEAITEEVISTTPPTRGGVCLT